MEERRFAKFAFLIVVVVAVVGLLVGGSVDITGFAAKKSAKAAPVKKLQVGQACTSNSQCVSNSCLNKRCAAPAKTAAVKSKAAAAVKKVAAKTLVKAKAPAKSPACSAAEKAVTKTQAACKSAQNAYKAAPKKCDDAKKAYAAAQVSYTTTPSEKTKKLLDQKKKEMDSFCAAVEKVKQNQDTACAAATHAVDNKNVVCAPPAPAAAEAAPPVPAAEAAPPVPAAEAAPPVPVAEAASPVPAAEAAPPAPAPEAEWQAAMPEPQAAAPEPAPAQPQAVRAGLDCTDTDLNLNHIGRVDITSFTLNYTVAGIVHGVGGQGMTPLDYADSCDSPTMLKEFYCSYGNVDAWATDANYDCASEGKVCQNGACVGLPVASPCQRNNECQQGLVCRGSRIQVGHPEQFSCQSVGGGGVACDENADCAYRHSCLSGRCTLPLGNPCNTDIECDSQQCQNNVCVAPAAQQASAVGAPCLHDRDCASSMCTWEGNNELMRQVCEEPNQPAGASCQEDRECASGLCGWDDRGEHVCEEPNQPLGARCEIERECASGRCSASRCAEALPAGAFVAVDEADGGMSMSTLLVLALIVVAGIFAYREWRE